MNEWTLALSAAAFVLALLSLILLLRLIKRQPDYERLLRESWNANLPALKTELTGELRASRGELTGTVQTTMKTFADSLALAQTQTAERQDVRLRELIESLEKNQLQLKSTIAETNRILAEAQEKQFAMQDKRMQGIEAQFTAFTAAVQSRLETLQKDNSEQLEKMRVTVDEKLQKTLDERISQSFRLVNERLQEVYTGLGEMKTLANGVGDLKKVLSNVKTRGIVGEYQLGALIDDILTRDQFEENVITKKGSTTRVEYAIKMPGEDGSFVYLPVDSKFPGDTYGHLQDAYASGDAQAVENARHALEMVLRSEAKDIREKYVEPPYTTAFGILFLPFEGLYAEVVNAGLLEVLQRDYQVNVAGPSTMAALLNSLQMGFKTLAIQKRSGEVWQLLGAVKTEFDKFGQGLTKMQQRLRQTDEELDKLIGVRSRAISRKLRSVQSLDEASASALLEIDDMNELPGALSETGGVSDQVGN